jgi:hypothetical protein
MSKFAAFINQVNDNQKYADLSKVSFGRRKAHGHICNNFREAIVESLGSYFWTTDYHKNIEVMQSRSVWDPATKSLVQRSVKKIYCSEKRGASMLRGLFGSRYNLSYHHIYCILQLSRYIFDGRHVGDDKYDEYCLSKFVKVDKIIREAEVSLISPGAVGPGVSAGFHAIRAGYLDNALIAAGYPLINKVAPANRPAMLGQAWPFPRILGTAEN